MESSDFTPTGVERPDLFAPVFIQPLPSKMLVLSMFYVCSHIHSLIQSVSQSVKKPKKE